MVARATLICTAGSTGRSCLRGRLQRRPPFRRHDDLLFRDLDAEGLSTHRDGWDLVLTATGDDTFGTVRLSDLTVGVENSLIFV